MSGSVWLQVVRDDGIAQLVTTVRIVPLLLLVTVYRLPIRLLLCELKK